LKGLYIKNKQVVQGRRALPVPQGTGRAAAHGKRHTLCAGSDAGDNFKKR